MLMNMSGVDGTVSAMTSPPRDTGDSRSCSSCRLASVLIVVAAADYRQHVPVDRAIAGDETFGDQLRDAGRRNRRRAASRARCRDSRGRRRASSTISSWLGPARWHRLAVAVVVGRRRSRSRSPSRPRSSDLPSSVFIFSISSGVAFSPTARSPMTIRRIGEWPAKKPALRPILPSSSARYSPKLLPVPRHGDQRASRAACPRPGPASA